MERQNKTRKAIVRPMIDVGPIKNWSTTASLLASIVEKIKMERSEKAKKKKPEIKKTRFRFNLQKKTPNL